MFVEAEKSEYIVGGVNAAPGEIPYQISLQCNGEHICGGSIINDNWILTAAHCVDECPVSKLSILAGTTELRSGVRVAVAKVIPHQNYKRPNHANDVAVVQLKEGLKFDNNIKAVKLGTENIGPGVIGIVSGWGFIDQNGEERTGDLKKLVVGTITNKQCSESYRVVVAGNLCTLNVKGQGFCEGDSGGPLVEEKSKVQIGLVSANILCARGKPDLYTRISTYLPWIQKHIQ